VDTATHMATMAIPTDMGSGLDTTVGLVADSAVGIGAGFGVSRIAG
jgi:hypothetical protein